jgi:hypothetical protein
MDAEWIIVIFSTISLGVGTIMWQQTLRLEAKGKKCLGTIISNNFRYGKDGGYYYPVIRFVTESKTWITRELNVGFQPAKKEGAKIRIVYNEDDPNDFQLDSILMLHIIPRLLVALGITGIGYGLMMYLGYI